MVKKVLGWAFIIFLVFFVVSRPASAAQAVKSIGNMLLTVGQGFGNFFSSLVT